MRTKRINTWTYFTWKGFCSGFFSGYPKKFSWGKNILLKDRELQQLLSNCVACHKKIDSFPVKSLESVANDRHEDKEWASNKSVTATSWH